MHAIAYYARGGVRACARNDRNPLVTLVLVGQMKAARVDVAGMQAIAFLFFALDYLLQAGGQLHAKLMRLLAECEQHFVLIVGQCVQRDLVLPRSDLELFPFKRQFGDVGPKERDMLLGSVGCTEDLYAFGIDDEPGVPRTQLVLRQTHAIGVRIETLVR